MQFLKGFWMMTDINAGIVVVTEFCTSENSKFTSYINYMDREEARKKTY